MHVLLSAVVTEGINSKAEEVRERVRCNEGTRGRPSRTIAGFQFHQLFSATSNCIFFITAEAFCGLFEVIW